MYEDVDFKAMVLNFRVSELQVLLGFARRNKSGKKQDLQARALELLSVDSIAIKMKIIDLHRQRFNLLCSGVDVAPVRIRSSTSESNPPLEPLPAPIVNANTCVPVDHNRMNPVACPPVVRFEPLPFCDTIAELLQPSPFEPKGSGPFHENHFSFTLTAQQAHQVTMSRDTRPGATAELDVRIHLRFSLVENVGRQDYNFPKNLTVKVNEKMFEIPVSTPSNRAGVEPKRPNKPLDITSGCKLSPYASNDVSIAWTSEFGKNYGVAIYLVRRLSATILLQRLKDRGARNPDYTRVMINDKLRTDLDDEICTTTLKAPLICPLGKLRMQYPCRAITCNHLQCFDARTFLQMNEKKPTWACPVCDKHVLFRDIAIDGLFLEIVAQAPVECTDVQFYDDGSWTPVMDKVRSNSSIETTENQSRNKGKKIDIIELSSDSEDDVSLPMSLSSSPLVKVELPSAVQQPVIHHASNRMAVSTSPVAQSYLSHISPTSSVSTSFGGYSTSNSNPFSSLHHSSSPSSQGLHASSRLGVNMQVQNNVPSSQACDFRSTTLYPGSGLSPSPYHSHLSNPFSDLPLQNQVLDYFGGSEIYNLLNRLGDSRLGLLPPHPSTPGSQIESNSDTSNHTDHRANVFPNIDDIISLD